jgi:hypothetical protein
MPRSPYLLTIAILALLCSAVQPLHAQEQAVADPLPELATIATGMQAEAQRLEDVQALQRLQHAYGYYIDKGYWREAADLFTSSATLEVGVDGVYLGKDRVQEMLIRYGNGSATAGPGLPFGVMNRHMQLQPVITVAADGRTAQARWRNLSLLGTYLQGAYWGDSILENTYRKENGIWKIQSLHLYPNFVAPYQGGWATLGKVPEDWSSQASRDFPPDAPPTFSYRPFPELYTAPFHYPAPTARAARGSWQVRLAAINAGEHSALKEALLLQARELDNLAAEREIENLQAMYGYYIDKGLWNEAAALFSGDASYEFGQSGVYLGKARIRAALELMGPKDLESGMLNNYSMLQPVISVAEDNITAKARWRSEVQLARGGMGIHGGGVYENEYVNEGGVWKISKLHYYVTFWADYAKGRIDGTLPMEGPSEVLAPDLPPTSVYGTLPDVYLVPYHYQHPVTRKPQAGKDDRS